MTTTYYLLRTKSTSQGDGAFLGVDVNGTAARVPDAAGARRFGSIEEAEQYSQINATQFGGFEIEVRTASE